VLIRTQLGHVHLRDWKCYYDLDHLSEEAKAGLVWLYGKL